MTNTEMACILAELFDDKCACDFNDIDEWLPFYCKYSQTECPYPPGVGCWEQLLEHWDKRGETR